MDVLIFVRISSGWWIRWCNNIQALNYAWGVEGSGVAEVRSCTVRSYNMYRTHVFAGYLYSIVWARPGHVIFPRSRDQARLLCLLQLRSIKLILLLLATVDVSVYTSEHSGLGTMQRVCCVMPGVEFFFE